nr:8709_t:CDS:2 [Entrophospora candida]
MGHKQQRAPHGRYISHRIYIYVVAVSLAFLIFTYSPYFNRISSSKTNPNFDDDGNIVVPTIPDKVNTNGTVNSSGHYSILFVISTKISHTRHRRALREYLFGIRNNLQPCMRQDGDVYYKFLVEPYDVVPKFFLRDFRAESVEYDDIVEFPNHKNERWQDIVLDWTQSLAKEDITFDHLAIIKDTTIIDLQKLKLALESSVINGQYLTNVQKTNLVWGPFESLLLDDLAIILGSNAIPLIIESKPVVRTAGKRKDELVARTYHYYRKYPANTDLFFVNDIVGLMEFPNSVENIPVDTTIAVGGVYLEDDLKDVATHLSIKTTLICHPNHNHPRIAVVTSSFVYDNLCMLPVAKPTADNKRSYAQLHDYSFVGRSYEFAQQIYKNRKTVWGKFDAIEKVLPYYDWIFWLDMDTIITNKSVSVESLLEKFVNMVGGEENFSKINLVVARPVHDKMINAGVFLLRNSEWSRSFIRKCQYRTDLYKGNMYEQRAMWDLMRDREWESGVLLLDQDDRTFNTFPSRFIKGDFVVHYAPDGCPSKPMLDAMGKVKLMEENPDAEISLSHGPDH